MAEQNPTVIIAHLDDEKLRKSIDSLVGYVDDKFKAMTTSTTNAVNTMQNELQKLGSLNAKGVGGAGGGELGITKALQRAKQEAKESSMTFDQMAASMQKATTGNGNKTIFSTMDTELSILKERLVEAKSQVESFTAMARRGAETGDKGLFTFSTENLHKYEAEVEKITQQISNLTAQRQALKEMLSPQGDAFKNYVDSLTKANPELAALNAQYKEGKSLLQQQTDAVKEKTKVEETNAAEIQKTWEMEQKLHQEQGKRYDAQNEINRQLEIENSKTAENLAFQERINAARAAKEGGVGKRVRETNELTGAIAGLLGIQEREVAVTNVEGASQHRLANYLNQLKTAYQRLDKEGMSASHGKMLADEIQRVSRAYAEMTKQMNRPTSLKNALGLDENTLDRIAYKIQQLNAYRSGLNITDPKQVGEMRTVENEIDRLKKKQDELMGKNQQLLGSNNALARSWNYMKNRLAFYFTVGASTAFVKNLIEVRSQYEMNERALGILIDSAERGTQIFNELSQMALVSPYTLIELSSAAKQLTAYDVAAKDVVDTTRRLADISAAVGLPVERLTYALGQIKAYGYLNSRDARMFLNAGIPLVKNLADHYTELEGKMVSVGDVYDRMKKKAIDYNDVMQVITEMTDEGGKFFDFQAKMADTLKVQLANLTLAWNNMLNEIGKSEQGVLVGGIKGLKELFLQWDELKRILTDVAVVFGVARASQLALNFILGKGVAAIDAIILANKRRLASELEQKSLVTTLTASEQALIATKKRITAADYENMLSSRNLTKQQALMLVAFRGRNKALMDALVNMKLLTQAEVQNMTIGKGVRLVIDSIGLSIKGLAASLAALAPALLVTAGIMAAVEAFQYYRDQAEKTEELNKAIADHAKEASDALGKFIADNKKNIGNMTNEDAEKMWEALRDQIELSSAASTEFIRELLKAEDINQRLEKGFDYASKIERATNAMAGLDEAALKVSQDSVFGGMFGEGLAEDLEDYIESLNKWRSRGESGRRLAGFVVEDKNEAERELQEFADNAAKVLHDRLGDAGIADPVMLREGIERIKKEVKAANPQIRGAVEQYFDIRLDSIMAEKFQGVYDQSYSLSKLLIERIKRDSGTVLQGLSDDILDTSKELDDNVVDAIEKAFDKMRSELPPEMQGLVDDLQRQMNNNPIVIRYMLQEAGSIDIRDAIQKDFDKHFGLENAQKPIRPTKPLMTDFRIDGGWATDFDAYNKAMEDYNQKMEDFNAKQAKYDEEKAKNARVYAEFNKEDGEDRVKWGKRLLDAEKEANEQAKAAIHTQEQIKIELGEQAALSDERYKAAVKDEEAAQSRAKAAREAYNYEHLYNEEKTKGGSGSKKDEFGDALAKEVQYISDIQKRFNEYQKMGVDAQQALTLATDEYGKSIIRNNAILQKYGVRTLSSEQLATMPLQEIRDFYKEQLNGAISSAKGVEALEKAIANLNVEITKIDYKRITDGLNNKLSKIKDEYELAVELDANPELGNIFMDIFDIDPNNLPNTIDAYAKGVMDALNRSFEKQGKGFRLDTLSLTDDDLKAYKAEAEKQMGAISEEDYKNIEKYTKEIRNLRKKDREDTLKQTQDLQYKLGDVNEKIAIESKKLADLQVKYQKETNDEKKRLLDLQIKDQQKVIDELKSQALSLMPEYARVFNSIAEHSAGVARRLQRDLMKVYDSAIFDSASNSWTLTSSNGTQTKLSDTQYRKEREKLTKEMRKSQSNFQKIKEAFKPSDKDGVVDYAKGLELIAEEANKAANGLHTIADIVDALGGSEEAVEVLNDVATSMEGVGTAMQGYAKIQSGDVIGGAVDMIKGTWSAVSTWLDNGNKKIDREIKKSENAVKDLELAYKNLERAVEKAYGTAVIGAQKVAIANKEAQLAEVKRQLKLEESRDSKHRDENRIRELRSEIIDLENEIADKNEQIVNDLLGISSVGDAMESLMDGFVEALRSGEDAMKVFDESVDDMIANMVKKMFTTKILQPWFEQQWETIQQEIDKRGTEKAKDIEFLKEKASSFSLTGDRDVFVDVENDELAKRVRDQLVKNGVSFQQWGGRWAKEGDVRQAYEDLIREANNSLIQATTPTAEDIEKFAELLRSGQPIMEGSIDEIKELLVRLGLMKDSANKNLSALQQGIQGVTEETASALEAYMNGVSQQVYLQSDLLTQIRDAVVAIDSDAQLGTQAQMLLQLQQSYAIQVAIQGILAGWSNPSGLAVRVEMV